jgi:DNA segregation ATPase FtsK/SpoIIIE, S-DNA-T family
MKSKLDKARVSSEKTKTRKRNSEEDYSIPVNVKKQIIGFAFILFGILLGLAVVSFSQFDDTNLKGLNIISVFGKETNKIIIKNWLGIVGAVTSRMLVTQFCGYFSLIIPVIFVVFGITVIAKKSMLKPLTISIYLLALMLVLAASAGYLRIMFGSNNIQNVISGSVGDFFASIFYNLLGSVGAAVLLFILLISVIFLLIDLNIVTSLIRLKLLFRKLFELFKKEEKALLDKKAEKEELKKKKLEGQDENLKDAIKKEQEKIKKAKFNNDETDGSESLIKETEINRPKEVEESPEAKQEKKIKELKPKQKEIEIEKNLETKDSVTSKPTKESENKFDNKIVDETSEDDEEEEDYIDEVLENYKSPSLEILENPSKEEFELIPDEELNLNGKLLQEKLLKFGIEIEKVYATPGPVVTLYEMIPAADVKLSKIESLQDDIALAMKAKGIRMIIPMPGKGTVGVEIPNQKSQIVRVKSILSSKRYSEGKERLLLVFGKMINGEVFVDDLSKMPHALIAGATGSGKSVGINTIIASLLFRMHPADLKFVMIDPKKIELSLYAKLKKHFLATTRDVNEAIITTPANAVLILKSVELEMEDRYNRLANAGVRDIHAYNSKFDQGLIRKNDIIRHRHMPNIIVIIDELADLMITAKRDIEDPIARIAQMARAVGIHLIVATQRPSVDVITGVIKANFPVRIAYQVASKIDSRTILDMGGADALLRNGDMLYLSSATPKPVRIQNAYISTEECERIVEFIGEQAGYSKPYFLPSLVEKRFSGTNGDGERDPLFKEAAELVIKLGQCSTSTLQRRLKIGYARAARIVDQMEFAGIVGPNNGAKGREILIYLEDLPNYL